MTVSNYKITIFLIFFFVKSDNSSPWWLVTQFFILSMLRQVIGWGVDKRFGTTKWCLNGIRTTNTCYLLLIGPHSGGRGNRGMPTSTSCPSGLCSLLRKQIQGFMNYKFNFMSYILFMWQTSFVCKIYGFSKQINRQIGKKSSTFLSETTYMSDMTTITYWGYNIVPITIHILLELGKPWYWANLDVAFH